jgi:hypothetical protein
MFVAIIRETIETFFRQKHVLEYFEKIYMRHFPQHAVTFIHSLLGWILLHFFSKRVSPILFPMTFSRTISGEKSKNYITNWAAQFVSMVHAVVVVVKSWPLVFASEFAGLREDPTLRLFGYNSYASDLYAITLSYFIYDFCCTVYNRAMYSKAFIMHATFCSLVFALTFVSFT